jgi:hypothetical protein
VSISADRAWDTQRVFLGRGGRFEFTGVPNGKYETFASVRGYQSSENGTLTVDRDIDEFRLVLSRQARR